MAKGSSGDGAGSHLPPLVDPRFVKALDHVLRQHILLAAVQREVSPCELSEELGEELSQVSYHVQARRYDCDGMIERTRTEPRRGAAKNYYRATEKTLLPAKAWRRVKKGLRAVVGAGQASDLFEDLAGALKAGEAGQGSQDHISRTPPGFLPQGKRRVKAIAERAAREVERRAAGSGATHAEGRRRRGQGRLAPTPSRRRPSRPRGSRPSCARAQRRAHMLKPPQRMARTAALARAAGERRASAGQERRGAENARRRSAGSSRQGPAFPPRPHSPARSRRDRRQPPAEGRRRRRPKPRSSKWPPNCIPGT